MNLPISSTSLICLGFSSLVLSLTGGCVMPGQKPALSSSVEAQVSECDDEALIDDGEDNNNQGAVKAGRGGYWYTYVDDMGSTVNPPAGSVGGQFTMSEGGAQNSQFAARMNGVLASGGVTFGAMGVNFTDPKDVYDASKYGGVSFWAKRGAGSIDTVRIKMPDTNTDPEGENCSKCFDDFGTDITVTESWRKFVVPFSNLRQQGWGDKKRTVDKGQSFGLQWQAQVPGASYDIWIDDIRFVGCEG